jgi:hypothetical protein
MDVIEIMQLTRLVLTLINLHVFSLYVIGLISECAIDVAHQQELINVRHRINIFCGKLEGGLNSLPFKIFLTCLVSFETFRLIKDICTNTIYNKQVNERNDQTTTRVFTLKKKIKKYKQI